MTVSAPRSIARANLLRIYAAAVAAADPRRVIARAFAGEVIGGEQIPAVIQRASGIRLIAVGKAAPGMAAEVSERAGDRLRGGVVIAPKVGAVDRAGTADGQAAPAVHPIHPALRVMYGAHPLPDTSSEAAGRAALEVATETVRGELLIVALSGGASAMMAAPAEGISLNDKIAVTSSLMRAGAGIRELNIVRKHLSAIKGGGLLLAIDPTVSVLAVILSDVPGNDLATIGSGPLAADPSTFSDAIGVMKRRKLWGRTAEAVRGRLERGAAGELAETVKPDSPILGRVTSVIAGDNRIAVGAAAAAAEALGYRVQRWRDLEGEANEVGHAIAVYLSEFSPERRPVCVLAGGEPVVTVQGNGRGGRAQQAALAAAIELARVQSDSRIMGLFAGTDGIDGPTDAAGAIFAPATVARAAEAGIDAAAVLARNDAYRLFQALGDLIVTGATGTNVADILIALVHF